MANVTEFPTLYQKGSTGKIKQWSIRAEEVDEALSTADAGLFAGLVTARAARIVTTYGQVGAKLQTTSDTITTGKNVGRSNMTTAYEQARLEAEAKWQKKKDSGYVEDLSRAGAGETDNEFKITPMLAHRFDQYGHKMPLPCAAQPKLDGIRCLAEIGRDRSVKLWSRKLKRFLQLPHIERALAKRFGELAFAFDTTIVLDGELYNHALKEDFEIITSIVRQETEPHEQHELCQYHIYDVVDEARTFDERLRWLHNHLAPGFADDTLQVVETHTALSIDDLTELFEHFRKLGYEGAMARNLSGLYEQSRGSKRSYTLLKLKEFYDIDCTVIGVVEGRGKLQGKVGAFKCLTPDGVDVEVTPAATEAEKQAWFENPELWQGKVLMTKYQGFTKDGSLRFPVGLRFRDEVEGV